ncbi:MAG TPA: glutamate synthase-related protein [Blastocatellia bacterium]|nr:glutamate synthase-related protein [Blastocatellia bacterium]
MNATVMGETEEQRIDLERDSCGVGFIADLQGRRRHDILEMGLTALSRMRHRGAVSADAETGDGAGVLFQLPSQFFRRELLRRGVRLSPKARVAVGMVFLPASPEDYEASKRTIEDVIARTGRAGASLHASSVCSDTSGSPPRSVRIPLQCLGWRRVPVDLEVLGEEARAACPIIEQVIIAPTSPCSSDALERTLFLVRKEIEHRLSVAGLSAHIVSLSHRTIVYKALLVSSDLRRFFPDLQRLDFRTRFTIFHGRYSTNTRPSWRLVQPFRFLAHNGEINTLQGNRRWVQARTEMLASVWGGETKWLVPLLDERASDSANLDNVLELLFFSGRSLLHAMSMLVPEAYGRDPEKDPAIGAFYEYHECLIEPWDGPAALCFTDGRIVGAALDRNGLRPARYVITSDGLMVLASEVGVLPLSESHIVEKGRLGPGSMVALDTASRRLYRDEEIKRRLARRRPYRHWLKQHLIEIDRDAPSVESDAPSLSNPLKTLQRTFGYTREDLELILSQIAIEGKEPIGSMGDDTPLPALSQKPRLIYDYFKQLFAQVTNPPIDPLRERLVMSLDTWIGPRSNWLKEEPEACRMIRFRSPILTGNQFRWLKAQRGLPVAILPTRFPVSRAGEGLRQSIERLCAQAEKAVEQGAGILILSDRNVSGRWAPIPMLLAVGAVHQHLLRSGKRMRVGLVAEVGDARQDHHFACLIGYGASAVYPYLAYESVAALAEEKAMIDRHHAVITYRQVIGKGLLKIMSKMGISVLSSYHGAQLFEAVGLAPEVISRCFSGTPSRIGGVGWEGIAADVLQFHQRAFGKEDVFFQPGYHSNTTKIMAPRGAHVIARSEGTTSLDDYGFYRFRKNGEYHAFNPGVIRTLHRVAQSNGDQGRGPAPTELYHAYRAAVEDRPPLALRDFLTFDSPRRPISISEVEPVGEIVKRFSTSGMSHGALSREAHEALAIAMNRLGARSNSGEGGEDPSRYRRPRDGDWAGNAIKQVASARFGVTPAYLVSADELEIKIAQGSKPGEGGQLPGHKVTVEIARLRHATPGIALISPPPHHDIYSIEDLAELIYDLRQINPRARIAVKLVAEAGIGTIAAGVVKAGADVVHISGHDGGTGASPLSSIKYAGIPWELGLREVQAALMANALRGRVVLRVDGGLKTGRDVVLAAMLGADEFGFGTAALIALGCVMARQCHLNTCPVGIATQREDLRARFRGKPEHVVRFFLSVAEQVREILAHLGFRRFEEIIGRSDLVKLRAPDGFVLDDAENHTPTRGTLYPGKKKQPSVVVGGAKSARLDLSILVEADSATGSRARRFLQTARRQHPVLDDVILGEIAPSLERGQDVHLSFHISNTDRAVGARLAGEIVRRYGDKGLSRQSIEITFRGTAGQSFGAFCVSGLRLLLFGDANDYVGKGMAGGEIVIRPSEAARFTWHENVIVGNTVLYGATGGRLFAAGRAGERFAVRNSGAVAVVEGVGDHGCEYMTGGAVVVLGDVGFNFAAGMTGGIAIVLDETERLIHRVNHDLVSLAPLETADEQWLRALLVSYWEATSSPRARMLLDSWSHWVTAFRKILPKSPGEMALPPHDRLQDDRRWDFSDLSYRSGESPVVTYGSINTTELARSGRHL